MPAYSRMQLKGVAGLITYTVDSDGTLLLAVDDLVSALGTPGAECDLLSRVTSALEKKLDLALADSNCPDWIAKDREIWELQRWEPFVLSLIHI